MVIDLIKTRDEKKRLDELKSEFPALCGESSEQDWIEVLRDNIMADEVKTVYTAQEAAELLSVTAESVKRWIKSGKLRGVRVGSKEFRISRHDLEEYYRSLGGGSLFENS